MLILGLTGSIGMGKSTTAARFAARGVPVYDSDKAVHRLLAGDAQSAVEAAFPGVVVAGSVDRARLAARVIGDEAAMARLEAILHPMVWTEQAVFLQAARQRGARLVVLDVPLLFESRSEHRYDAIAVVTAPAAVQRQRVLARPGMTPERFERLNARQMPDKDKRRKAHALIDTSGDEGYVQRQVDDLMRSLAACA